MGIGSEENIDFQHMKATGSCYVCQDQALKADLVDGMPPSYYRPLLGTLYLRCVQMRLLERPVYLSVGLTLGVCHYRVLCLRCGYVWSFGERNAK